MMPNSTYSELKTLSAREEQCAHCLLQSMSIKAIGRHLQLSPRTVEFYLENVKSKFSCKTKTELIITLARLLL